VKEVYRERLGLSKPLPLQYLNYLGALLRLDLGFTDQGRDVWSVIQHYFPATVELAAFSSGDYQDWRWRGSASHPGTIFDVLGRLFGIITYAIRLLGGDAHAVNLCRAVVGFPRVAFPPRCHLPLAQRDFTQLIVAGW